MQILCLNRNIKTFIHFNLKCAKHKIVHSKSVMGKQQGKENAMQMGENAKKERGSNENLHQHNRRQMTNTGRKKAGIK